MGETRTIAEPQAGSTAARCPFCGEDWRAYQPPVATRFRQRAVRRCLRCGGRFAEGGKAPQRVANCSTCMLPFLASERHPDTPVECSDCRDGRMPEELAGTHVALGADHEIRVALGKAWRPVGSEKLSRYLDGVARRVAHHVEGTPDDCRVMLFEDPAWRTLALPSGALLVSVGLLSALEDEAELAFVLGHELAHVSADAGPGLVRFGVGRLSSAKSDGEPVAWCRAAQDVLELGYGDDRERVADLRALNAMIDAGYDPDAAGRFLDRLDRRSERGEGEVRDQVTAHPPAADRARRLRAKLADVPRPGADARCNREVFRRAAGYSALRTGLGKQDGFVVEPEVAEAKQGFVNWSRVGSAVGIGILAMFVILVWIAALS